MLKKSSVVGGKLGLPTNYKPMYGANVGQGGGGGDAKKVPFSGIGKKFPRVNGLPTSHDSYMRKPK